MTDVVWQTKSTLSVQARFKHGSSMVSGFQKDKDNVGVGVELD
jgi:hypothetical protein